MESGSQSGSSEPGTQRKRKASFVTQDLDGREPRQQSKRIKMDICDSECLEAEEQSAKDEISGSLERDAPAETPAEELQPASDSRCDILPEHIQVERSFICPVDAQTYYLSSQFNQFVFSIKEQNFQQ